MPSRKKKLALLKAATELEAQKVAAQSLDHLKAIELNVFSAYDDKVHETNESQVALSEAQAKLIVLQGELENCLKVSNAASAAGSVPTDQQRQEMLRLTEAVADQNDTVRMLIRLKKQHIQECAKAAGQLKRLCERSTAQSDKGKITAEQRNKSLHWIAEGKEIFESLTVEAARLILTQMLIDRVSSSYQQRALIDELDRVKRDNESLTYRLQSVGDITAQHHEGSSINGGDNNSTVSLKRPAEHGGEASHGQVSEMSSLKRARNHLGGGDDSDSEAQGGMDHDDDEIAQMETALGYSGSGRHASISASSASAGDVTAVPTVTRSNLSGGGGSARSSFSATHMSGHIPMEGEGGTCIGDALVMGNKRVTRKAAVAIESIANSTGTIIPIPDMRVTQWSETMDARLQEALELFNKRMTGKWEKVAEYVGHEVTSNMCRHRGSRLASLGKQGNFRTGRWSKEEVDQLRLLVEKYSKPGKTENKVIILWEEIAAVLGRSGVNCHSKWNLIKTTQHNTSLKKGPFTEEEDAVIVKSIEDWGDKGAGLWSNLERELNRPAGTIRNRWYINLVKKFQKQAPTMMMTNAVAPSTNPVVTSTPVPSVVVDL